MAQLTEPAPVEPKTRPWCGKSNERISGSAFAPVRRASAAEGGGVRSNPSIQAREQTKRERSMPSEACKLVGELAHVMDVVRLGQKNPPAAQVPQGTPAQFGPKALRPPKSPTGPARTHAMSERARVQGQRRASATFSASSGRTRGGGTRGWEDGTLPRSVGAGGAGPRPTAKLARGTGPGSRRHTTPTTRASVRENVKGALRAQTDRSFRGGWA